jgi:AcrR family transcriptional regulator
MTAPDASTRDRLLDAAIALFARQGYASTSIADIHRACGLSPGSGALYKHFPSKKALLQEAVRRQVEQMGAMRDDYDRTRPTDLPGALRGGADQIWANIENNTELLRVMFREPEALDDMIDDVWSAATTTAYQRIGRALGGAKNACAAWSRIPKRPAPCCWRRWPTRRSRSCWSAARPAVSTPTDSAKRGSGWPKVCSPALRRPDSPLQGRVPNSRETFGRPERMANQVRAW